MALISEDIRRINSSVNVLEIRLGETLVGTLTRLANDANIFAFAPAYAEDPNRPTLSLGFKGPEGTLVESNRSTGTRLLPFFSNLLPEGHLRDYLAKKGGIHPEREFFLLWLLGTDLPGAVTAAAIDGVLPPREEESQRSGARPSEQPLRFSLAGVQLKFSALMETDGGLTIPIGGAGGDWIAKLPSSRFKAVPENEYAMLTLAAAIGIDVPEVRLIPTKEIENLPDNLPEAFGNSLAVRRFDRTESGHRIHIEDFAQVFRVYPPEKYDKASYGNIARVLWIEAGEAAIVEFVRRLAFIALIGNGDAHLKNWSLIYPDRRTPKLAPAYDLVGTVAYMPDQELGLSIAGTKSFIQVDSERFRRFAERAGLPVRLVIKTANETAQAVRDYWPKHEPVRRLPDDIREAIERHMGKVAL